MRSISLIVSLFAASLVQLLAQAQTFLYAECARGSSRSICTIRIDSGLITITPSSTSPNLEISIKANKVLSYDYFSKRDERYFFSSWYHHNFKNNLERNYSYTITWESESGNTEAVTVSLKDATSNKNFYPIMRVVTGLELGVPRQR
jgi:hypothetical protein